MTEQAQLACKGYLPFYYKLEKHCIIETKQWKEAEKIYFFTYTYRDYLKYLKQQIKDNGIENINLSNHVAEFGFLMEEYQMLATEVKDLKNELKKAKALFKVELCK